MVNELRKRDGILALSLVAIDDKNIVGHIICSNAEVKTLNGITSVLNIGPISVLPEYQRKGIGKALITNMIDRAKKLGCGAILFFWSTRILSAVRGFKEASAFAITDSEGYNYPTFMRVELIPNYLQMPTEEGIVNQIFIMMN